MRNIFRSSEFWIVVLGAFGQLGAASGFWAQEDYNKTLLPALVYIIGRVLSKVVKALFR